jgi:hypothetical protein
VGDAHDVIVDHDREVIRRKTIGLQDDLILDRVERPLDMSVDNVVDRDHAVFRHFQSDDVRLGPGALGRVLRIDPRHRPS